MEGQRLEEMKDEAEAEVFRACRAPRPWPNTNLKQLSAELAASALRLCARIANSLGSCFCRVACRD